MIGSLSSLTEQSLPENHLWYWVSVSTIIFSAVDVISTVYTNYKKGFARVFRLQQFFIKIFLLKLITTDFTENNYNMLTSLSKFNALTVLFQTFNPFDVPTTLSPDTINFSLKTQVENIPSTFLGSVGGTFVLASGFTGLMLLFSILFKLTVKETDNYTARDRFDSMNSSRIDMPLAEQYG